MIVVCQASRIDPRYLLVASVQACAHVADSLSSWASERKLRNDALL